VRECKRCGESKEETLFPQSHGKASGRTCNVCTSVRTAKWYSENSTEINKSRKERRLGPAGKARSVLSHMKTQSKKLGFPPPEFTLQEITEQVAYGSCAVTRLPFVLDYKGEGLRNPLAPSPDRINPKLGYTKANVQWVCWMFNQLKCDHGQEDVDRFIEALVRTQK
jgi:hypothetical protein